MKKILQILFIIWVTSFVLSVWSQIMFENIIEKDNDLILHLNAAMKYKQVLFYFMVAGAATIPLIVYFSLDGYRWARHIAASSIVAVVIIFDYLWKMFCCYA